MDKVITFDIETAKLVNEENGGWSGARAGKAGCSVVCLYDSLACSPFSYLLMRYDGDTLVTDLEELANCIDHLNSATYLVSWNGEGFDIPVLEAISERFLEAESFDLLKEMRRNAQTKTPGNGLTYVAERTLGLEKFEAGASAPDLLRSHQYGRLISYCLRDVFLTRMLCQHVEEHGFLIDPDGEQHPIEALGVPA